MTDMNNMKHPLRIKPVNPLGSKVFTVWIIDDDSKHSMRIGAGTSSKKARADAEKTLRKLMREIEK